MKTFLVIKTSTMHTGISIVGQYDEIERAKLHLAHEAYMNDMFKKDGHFGEVLNTWFSNVQKAPEGAKEAVIACIGDDEVIEVGDTLLEVDMFQIIPLRLGVCISQDHR